MATPKTTTKQKLTPTTSADSYATLAASTPEKKLHQRMVSFGHELSQDPVAARDFLAYAGITTSKGRLRKIFGG